MDWNTVWKGHKDRNRRKNRIKRSGQARLVYHGTTSVKTDVKPDHRLVYLKTQTVTSPPRSPDVILCGWLGSKHQLTNPTTWRLAHGDRGNTAMSKSSTTRGTGLTTRINFFSPEKNRRKEDPFLSNCPILDRQPFVFILSVIIPKRIFFLGGRGEKIYVMPSSRKSSCDGTSWLLNSSD